MKLYYGALSPFVRKVMVLAHEKNLVSALELVPAPLTPLEPNRDLMRANPLGKIPALELDDGMVLFDSPVICEHLDTLGSGPKLFPPSGAGAAAGTAVERACRRTAGCRDGGAYGKPASRREAVGQME